MSTRLTHLWVSNYRSIGDELEISFGDLTALVGPNGSGKSNILDVLRFLRDALTVGLEPALTQRLGIQRVRHASPKGARDVKITVQVEDDDEGHFQYGIIIKSQIKGQYHVESEVLSQRTDSAHSWGTVLEVQRGRLIVAPVGLAPTVDEEELTVLGVAAHPSVRPLVAALRALRVHSLYPHHLSQPQSAGSPPPLEDTGANWCSVLRSLSREAKQDLVDTMSVVLDDLVGVSVKASGGYYNPIFSHRLPGGAVREFAAAQESDGTLRLAGLITALVQDRPPPVLAIEEPELTINPGLLPLLHDQLKATAGRTQVIITTHSPDLLDLLDVDEVRVVRRDQGATTVGRVSAHQRDIVRAGLLAPGGLLRSGGFDLEGQQQNLFDDLEPVEVIGFPA